LADIDLAYAQVVEHVERETGVANTVLRRLTTQGAAPAGHAVGESKFDLSFGLLAAASAAEVADILDGDADFPIDSTKADPRKVHDAWMLLSPDQRAALIEGQPARFGNLNGIPAADRDKANRATLKVQLDRLAAALEAMGMDPTTDAEHLDGLSQGQIRVLRWAGLSPQEARQTLLLNAQLQRNGKNGATFLAYEPGAYGGQGRAAIAFGDVDHADNIAVCVPGLNSGLHNIDQVTGDALSLFRQSYQADRGRQTAVVAWQGYDAPGYHDVGFQGSAEAGAKLLAADVKALRTTHEGPVGTLTVVGHSYGSTTTGLALQREHLDVDQVVLIGSPGVGGEALTAADLGLDKSHVFVGSASRDLVSQAQSLASTFLTTATLGADPSRDTFGATRFEAESVDRGYDLGISDHSRYFDAVNHSESLYALAEISAGHGDRLGVDGMLAKPRHMAGIDTSALPLGVRLALRGIPVDLITDPEADRTPTAGHDRANDVGTPSP
jgi:pimeloyl-ACP methyl ester carboxylesterase